MGQVEKIKTISELMYELEKAKADADYWRLAYDKLIRHIEKQETYVRHLEVQLWGSR
jgi:hypothetical protein